jgi:RNase P/RNase MRP subunit POP5
MPRPRYVAFRVDAAAPISRRAFGNALRAAAKSAGWAEADGPHLTRYEWPHGIVRVDHAALSRCRALLPTLGEAVEAGGRVSMAVETLSSSGTLKALTDRLGILRERVP